MGFKYNIYQNKKKWCDESKKIDRYHNRSSDLKSRQIHSYDMFLRHFQMAKKK